MAAGGREADWPYREAKSAEEMKSGWRKAAAEEGVSMTAMAGWPMQTGWLAWRL